MLIKGSRRYNLRHNTERASAPEFGRMINGQALGRVADLRYGICHMSFNGCEVIAVHNALVHLGKPRRLTEIAFHMERYRMLLGFFGCNPFRIGHALRYFGVEAPRSRDASDAKAFIITFWTGRPFLSSIHTVFCIRTKDGIEVYNRYNSSHRAELCKDIDELTDNRRPIAVYALPQEENNKCQNCSEQTVHEA